MNPISLPDSSLPKRAGTALALVWLAAMTPVFADRDSALGTVDPTTGTFTGGRSPATSGDGTIKETEQVLSADPSAPNVLDSKIYHLRARCYGDTLIPLGRFGSGNFQLNWSTTGVVSSNGGSMTVQSHWGDTTNAGPFVITQQDSTPGVAKLRVIKGVSGDYEGAYLFLQYDHPYPGYEHTVSIAIMTTQEIAETYQLANAASALPVPVFSSASSVTKRLDFHKDAVFNGSVTIPGGNLILGSEAAITPAYLTANHYLRKNPGAASDSIIAIGQEAYATAQSVALGSYSRAQGTYNSLALMGGVTGVGENGRESAAIGTAAKTGGPSAFAMGYGAEANSIISLALGHLAQANAPASAAIGVKTRVNSWGGTAIGIANIGHGVDYWSDLNSVLEVGNAWPWDPLDTRSNAITTLVNGRTTLTSKYWTSSTPEVVPAEVYKSAADALAVEGHSDLKGNVRVGGRTTLQGDTLLNGKVTLAAPQGDISMGIYE